MKDEKPYSKNQSEDSRLNDYLQNKMSDQERHEFEMEFSEDPFLLDAMEGLLELNDPKSTNHIQQDLNHFIQKKTSKKKEKNNKLIQFPAWMILLTAIVLLMAAAGMVLIKFLHK